MKNLEIYYLQQSKDEIIILETKPYHNKLTVLNLLKKKIKFSGKVQKSIVEHYKESGICSLLQAKEAKKKIKNSGLGQYLPAYQTVIFNNLELAL